MDIHLELIQNIVPCFFMHGEEEPEKNAEELTCWMYHVVYNTVMIALSRRYAM